MNQELLTQAIAMFDTYEKWDAFIELSNNIGEIRRRNFEKLKSSLLKHFINDSKEPWVFIPFNTDQYRWFLKDYGQESICLLWRVQDLVLWCNPQFFYAPLAKDLLSTPEFGPILNCFDYTDSLSTPHQHHFVEERHRFSFKDSTSYSSPNEENFEKLSWFAGNRTDEMIQQISDKINKFRTPEITELLLELNRRCKK